MNYLTTEELADKTLAQLSEYFQQFKADVDAAAHSKEAEEIKSAFYKLLSKMKTEMGDTVDETLGEIEENFKSMFAEYKKDRAEFNRKQEAQKEENLVVKKQIIEELKALVSDTDKVSASFPALRELQDRWRAAGQVPAAAFRDLNEQYQFCMEQFYDMVKIDRDLRDLDFKKNLEAKEALCEAAEKLMGNENIVAAFNELQKLHESWKELGPVAKEVREQIWSRFKAATTEINKRYQEFFEQRKAVQTEALKIKTEICERMEQISSCEVKSSSEWNALSKEIEEMQQRWRKAGFSKDNNAVYERFRKSCDEFFARKREYYAGVKENLEENLAKKMEILREAEELKTSTEWKKATDQFIALQKRWKECGNVPRKKSEELWTGFRAACDEFFANREKYSRPRSERDDSRQGARPQRGPKDSALDKYRALKQEIATYENNIGFFSTSRSSEALVKQMQKKIEDAKAELARLESQING